MLEPELVGVRALGDSVGVDLLGNELLAIAVVAGREALTGILPVT